MDAHDYQPGTITVVLLDGRRFVYPSDAEPFDVFADLEAHGVRRGGADIARTVHVVNGVRIALDHREPRP